MNTNKEKALEEKGFTVGTAEEFLGLSDLDVAIQLLEEAARYLEHPDVEAIPFVLPASTVSKRIRALLAQV